MSRLKLYCPVESGSNSFDDEEPQILPMTGYRSFFPRLSGSTSKSQDTCAVLDRARSVFQNRCCPGCGTAGPSPIELDDAIRNRNNRPLPGTATLVGFHCDSCHSEWPA